MALSDYDRNHVGEIVHGEGSWFTARLLRALDDLLPHADETNRARLFAAFPEEVAAYEAWMRGDDCECWMKPCGNKRDCAEFGPADCPDRVLEGAS